MPTLIKRYANRKLYNTDSSRYITLKGIAKLLDEGHEVRVIDNETGEDITQVALSQILVGNQRAHEDPSDTLLTQILSRGGDALYGAIKKSVDDATEGLGEFQDRFRKLVQQAEAGSGTGVADRIRRDGIRDRGRGVAARDDAEPEQGSSLLPEIEAMVRRATLDAMESLELPRRADIERLSKHLDRVACAIERLDGLDTDSESGSESKSASGNRTGTRPAPTSRRD